MKAIFDFSIHGYTNKVAVLHKNVIEISKNVFKCKDCGAEWKQKINSPQVITEEEFSHYKKYKIIDCKELRK